MFAFVSLPSALEFDGNYYPVNRDLTSKNKRHGRQNETVNSPKGTYRLALTGHYLDNVKFAQMLRLLQALF
jgi:hypothetical protein